MSDAPFSPGRKMAPVLHNVWFASSNHFNYTVIMLEVKMHVVPFSRLCNQSKRLCSVCQ